MDARMDRAHLTAAGALHCLKSAGGASQAFSTAGVSEQLVLMASRPWAMSERRSQGPTAYCLRDAYVAVSCTEYEILRIYGVLKTKAAISQERRHVSGPDKLHNPVSVVDVTPATEEMKACCAIRGNARK
ncbi:hypothetical protein CISG_00852 [Coccidioides immitis RMSCC 3703]|uniref:Uncharacterized protein n=1 Tax=Coccidioides immitis RMSCC 3703 TaxID=454286 RepID=A0A0J8QUH6_COCIT|nr:hypothetical protein CISG_00852 [Coccidioides immitis RMSCC 3703]